VVETHLSWLPATIRGLRLVPASNRAWDEYLDGIPHDFFHTSGCHRLNEFAGLGEAWLAVYGGGEKRVLWPYLLRNIDELGKRPDSGFRDVTSVYGYAGPLISASDLDSGFLKHALNQMVQAWRDQGVVSVFTRFNPILGNHRWLEHVQIAEDHPFHVAPVAMGKTVAIDLTKSQAEIWANYNRHMRQAVRKCEGAGMTSEWDAEWKYLDDFVRLYYSTMQRNQAAEFYYFPTEYFCKLKEVAGSHGSLVMTKYQGEIASAALVIEYGGIANLHLTASDTRFSRLSPTKLTIHHAQTWAQMHGNQWFHLGGGRNGNDYDLLFQFKK
jgi:Acetyltransferase (GNAT) domain